MIKGKKVILGISGGIAAYKIPHLIRLLVQEGAEVRCVCTKNAFEFVSRLTLECLSNNKVYVDLFEAGQERSTQHISTAKWGDVLLVAPATANIMAKFRCGIADDALSTLFLSFLGKVMVVPAMNVAMYENAATQENMAILRSRGVDIMEADEGFLACGDSGKGRMPAEEAIVERLKKNISSVSDCELDFKGKKVLITAGPTIENIDPVRYITNHSSGKMGYCIADEFVRRGAEVVLVSGKTTAKPQLSPSVCEKVESALEMFEACKKHWETCDIGVFAAAVADYRAKDIAQDKIKKNEETLTLELVKNPDILAWAGKNKSPKQYLMGFALESSREEENAREKLQKKNLDAIVLNSIRDEGSTFNSPNNKVSIIKQTKEKETYPLMTKEMVAKKIVESIKKALFLSLIFPLLFVLNAFELSSQELNCNIQVVSTRIQNGDKAVFETLQKALSNFVNGQKWTDINVGSGEKIACNMTLEIQERDYSSGVTKAFLSVQARRPVYYASYTSTIFNFMDRDISFTYNEYDPIEYSANSINSNLTAIFSFYSYIIIGLYLDSFVPNGGESCFAAVENIVNICQGFSESGWKSNERNNRNRFWLYENLTNGNYGIFHKLMYTYHRLGLDKMYEKPEEGRKYMLEAIDNLSELNTQKSALVTKSFFMDAKMDEIVAAFSSANQEEKEKIKTHLMVLEPTKKTKYDKL